METKEISYSQWLTLIKEVKEQGIYSEVFQDFRVSVPKIDMKEYQGFIHNELAKLEEIILSQTISKFQKNVNICMEENDLEVFHKGLVRLKKDILNCFFFCEISIFPIEIRAKVGKQMVDILMKFIKDFQKYIKRMEENESDIFCSEICYMYKKAKLEKYVEELLIDV